MEHPGAHILPYQGSGKEEIYPTLDDSTYIAHGVCIIGDVHIGANSSVWFNSVIRGDVNYVRIGDNTNIQDGSICHVTREKHPLIIGNGVTIGHAATLHGCTIEDNVLIGMGAVVLDGVVVEEGAMVAAGAVVPPYKVVKAGEVWAGNPAQKLRDIKPAEAEYLLFSGPYYAEIAKTYRKMNEQKS